MDTAKTMRVTEGADAVPSCAELLRVMDADVMLRVMDADVMDADGSYWSWMLTSCCAALSRCVT